MTVQQAAAAIGVGADAIYRFERDANSPSLETLDKMAGVYGVLIGDILPNSGGGYSTELFQPIAAALMGLSDDEMRGQLLILASQARLNRDSILRRKTLPRVEGMAGFRGSPYTSPQTQPQSDAPPKPFGVGEIEDAPDKDTTEPHLARHSETPNRPTRKTNRKLAG